MDDIPPILAMFFAEFDQHLGPKITYHIPDGFISQDNFEFDTFSEYMIPKSELTNRLVAITTQYYKIMGFPIQIISEKYDRNVLLFNLCLVFDKTEDIEPYNQIVTKIARNLKTMELESSMVSEPARKETLLQKLDQIMDNLNRDKECRIPIDSANTMDLKLLPQYANPGPVFDYQVPVLIRKIEYQRDLTFQRIMPFINGVNSVSRIAKLSKVSLQYVELAVQHLLYYGLVKLVDIFQFANLYAVTPKFSLFCSNKNMQQECIRFVSLPNSEISIVQLVLMYSALKESTNILGWRKLFPKESMMVDIRKFILFGILHDFLVRIHVYPIALKLDNIDPKKDKLICDMSRYLNGMYHFDMLCTKFGMSRSELHDLFVKYDIPMILR